MSLFHPFSVVAWSILSVAPQNLQSIIFYDRCSMLKCFFELISSLKRNRDCRNYNKQSWLVTVKLGRSSCRVLFLSNFKQILVKIRNMKCYKYRSISSWQTDRRTHRHDESTSLFRQFFPNAPTILTGDFGHYPSYFLTLYCKIRISPPLSLRKAKQILFSNLCCHVK